jgi:hypothetical protein
MKYENIKVLNYIVFIDIFILRTLINLDIHFQCTDNWLTPNNYILKYLLYTIYVFLYVEV